MILSALHRKSNDSNADGPGAPLRRLIRRLSNLKPALLCFCFIALATTPQGYAKGDDPNKLKAQLLVKEALSLVNTDNVDETAFDQARDKLRRAEELDPGGKVTKPAFSALQKKIQEEVTSLIREAEGDFLQPDDPSNPGFHYDLAESALRKADSIGGANALVYYDLAVIADRRGQKDKAEEYQDEAAEYLALCLDIMPDGKRKQEVEMLQAALITGTASQSILPPLHDQVARFNSLASQPEPYSRSEAQKRDSVLCGQLHQFAPALPDNPAVVLDLAKCAELDAEQQNAEQLYGKYITMAHGALNAPEVRAKLQAYSDLDTLPRDIRSQIQQHYSNAEKALAIRRLDIAKSEYQEAKKLDPTFSETYLRLAVFYDSCGNLELTRQTLASLAALHNVPVEDQREAQALLQSLSSRRARYDQHIAEAKTVIEDLNNRWYNLSIPLRIDRLNDAITFLTPAAEIFPNGWELAEQLAYIYELLANQRLALRCLDVMWFNDKPVYFYADVRIGSTTGKASAKRQNSIRSRVDVYPGYFTMETVDASKIFLEQIKSIETTPSGQLRVDTKDARVILLNLQSMNLLRGLGDDSDCHWGDILGLCTNPGHAMPLPLRRAQANKAGVIFLRYLGFEGVRFGSENFTATEKLVTIGWLAFNAMAIEAAITNSSTLIAHISQFYTAVGGLQNTIGATRGFVRMVGYQRIVTESSPFFLIPLDAVEPEFKTAWD